MRRARRLLAGLLAAGALLAATGGCAQSVDPIERLGRKAAQKVNHPSPTPAAGPPARPCGTVRPARTLPPCCPDCCPDRAPAVTPRPSELALRLTEC